MSWLDDEKGKNLLLNGAALTDRKKLEIIATGATHTDSESENKTTIDLSAAFAVYDDQAELATVVDLLAIGSLVHTLDGSPWTIVAKGSHASNGGTIVAGSTNAALRQYSGPVSARWFGAGTDVSATDNTTALNAAQATGELVRLEPGTVIETLSPVSLVRGFVCSDIATIRQTGAASILSASAKTGLILEGVRLEYAAASPLATHNGIELVGCSGAKVMRCQFDGFRGEAIRAQSCDDFEATNLTFTNAYNSAPGADASDVLRDIYITGSATNTTIEDVISTSGAGISIAVQTLTADSRQRAVTVRNCKVSGCRNYGIMFYSGANSDDPLEAVIEATVEGCHVSDIIGDLQTTDFHFGSGYYCLGDVRVQISGGRVRNVNQSTTNDGTLGCGAIVLSECRSASVENVDIDEANYHGIDIIAGANSLIMDVSNVRMTRVNRTGVRLNTNAANSCSVNITNTKILGLAASTSARGVYSRAIGNPFRSVTLDNVECTGDAASLVDGILVQQASLLNVRNCEVRDYGNYGIYCATATDAYFLDNKVEDTPNGLGTGASVTTLTHRNNKMLSGVTNPSNFNTATNTKGRTNFGLNSQAAGYTFLLSDGAQLQEESPPLVVAANGANANFTIPPYSAVKFPVGTRLRILRTGAGEVDWVAGAGVTVNSAGSNVRMANQHDITEAICTAQDVWSLTGALA